MNKTSFFRFLVLAAALGLCSGPLFAGAPLKINFQGRLDESGLPAEGSKNFIFKIYDAVSGGNLVWTSQTQALTLSNGVFSAVLSAGTPAALSTAAFSGARYVEMTVDGVPLSPRQEMVSAPYALVAQALAPDAEIPASSIGAGSVNDSHVVLSTAAIGSGKFSDSRVSISTGAFYGGFNGTDQLVRLDGTGRLPAADASLLSNLPAPAGVVARAGDTMTGQLTLSGSTLTVTGGEFSVGGNVLTAVGGRVGVGTDAPGYKLDVQGGSINASAGLCIADNCKGSWTSVDNLGNHTASQALDMAGYSIHNVSTLTVSGGAFSVGGSTLAVANGYVGIGTASPAQGRLDVVAAGSAASDMAQLWRNSAGTVVSSVSATGVNMAARFIGDGSQLTGVNSAANATIASATATLRADLNAVITSTAPLANAGNWNSAFTWGNHALAGYAAAADLADLETTAAHNASLADYAALASTQALSGSVSFTSISPTVPGVAVSSGLVVAAGRTGLGTASPNSVVSIGGSLSLPIRRIAASDTAKETDYTILADTSGDDVTVTLPDAALTAGRIYVVKRLSAVNSVIIDSAGGLVEGSDSQSLSNLQGEAVMLQSDGTDWVVLYWFWQ